MANLIDDLRGAIEFVEEQFSMSGPDGETILSLPEDIDDMFGQLRHVVAAYDALAPTPEQWASAPEWAQWYAIDGASRPHWFEMEPYCDDGEGCCWCPLFTKDGRLSEVTWAGPHILDKGIDLPLGLDWRLCLWRRPEGAQP